ncbi:MAG: virulence protein RhuM/Fic/DOC family protein [Bacilli bacterium]|nr:virulence protein RhuM/Fic/DOC family protein [Bacilli bacterium]
MKNEIILFEDQDVKLEVNMKDDTVWLSLDQIASLFCRNKSTISRHINNILKDELVEKEVVAFFATTTKHGSITTKTQTHIVKYFNLDMIISVGYRVNSKKGIKFRHWATKVLKEHLIKGYTINQKRLEYLEKTIKLIDLADNKNLKDESSEILSLINNYSKALNLLDEYDNKRVIKPKGNFSEGKITYDECKSIISSLNYKSDIFGLEKDKGLKSIINDIYLSYDNKDLYPSIEEKAANLLYLIIKNHIFIDGNKRIGATLFIYFLSYYNLLYREDYKVIDNNTLVALTLLIAESNPKDKDTLVDLTMNFICN